MKDVYFNRMPEYIFIEDGKLKKVDLNDWYFKKYTGIKTITYELNKDVFYEDKFNLCPKMKHQYIKYEENKKVNIMLNYIKEVLASGNEEVYKYILQWLSYMVKGNKNTSILYLKSIQGLGKSTLLEFLREFVIGEPLSLETGSRPLVSDFNSILGGKLFVYGGKNSPRKTVGRSSRGRDKISSSFPGRK